MRENHSLQKLHTTKRERALGALNGTLLMLKAVKIDEQCRLEKYEVMMKDLDE